MCKELKLIGYLANYQLTQTQYSALFYTNVSILDKLPNYEMKEINLFDDFPINTTYPKIYAKIQKNYKG